MTDNHTEKDVLSEEIEKAKEEIKVLKKKLESCSLTCRDFTEVYWFNNETISLNKKNKEVFLKWMNYNFFEMPNCEKNIFHDALKGFEEYSKLKGYIVFLSIDTSSALVR